MLNYLDRGDGPVLVLLHAFPLNSSMWLPQLDAFPDRRLIIPDLRGFGASPLEAAPSSLDDYADDVLALLDQLGIENFGLGGLSMGGYIAFAILRRAAERVTMLILADTRSGPDNPEGQEARENNAQLVEREGSAALAERMLPNLLAPQAPSELVIQLREEISAADPSAVAAALRSMAQRPGSAEDLAAFPRPTLIIVGSEDRLTPPSEAEAMHRLRPGSQLAIIEGAGHLANLEQPAAFNTALRSFLQDHSAIE